MALLIMIITTAVATMIFLIAPEVCSSHSPLVMDCTKPEYKNDITILESSFWMECENGKQVQKYCVIFGDEKSYVCIPTNEVWKSQNKWLSQGDQELVRHTYTDATLTVPHCLKLNERMSHRLQIMETKQDCLQDYQTKPVKEVHSPPCTIKGKRVFFVSEEGMAECNDGDAYVQKCVFKLPNEQYMCMDIQRVAQLYRVNNMAGEIDRRVRENGGLFICRDLAPHIWRFYPGYITELIYCNADPPSLPPYNQSQSQGRPAVKVPPVNKPIDEPATNCDPVGHRKESGLVEIDDSKEIDRSFLKSMQKMDGSSFCMLNSEKLLCLTKSKINDMWTTKPKNLREEDFCSSFEAVAHIVYPNYCQDLMPCLSPKPKKNPEEKRNQQIVENVYEVENIASDTTVRPVVPSTEKRFTLPEYPFNVDSDDYYFLPLNNSGGDDALFYFSYCDDASFKASDGIYYKCRMPYKCRLMNGKCFKFSAMEEMYRSCTSYSWNRTKYENIRDSIIYYDQLKNYEKLESDYVGQTCKPDFFQKLVDIFNDGLFPNQLEALELVIAIQIGGLETLVDGHQACKIVEQFTPFKDAFIETHTEPCETDSPDIRRTEQPEVLSPAPLQEVEAPEPDPAATSTKFDIVVNPGGEEAKQYFAHCTEASFKATDGIYYQCRMPYKCRLTNGKCFKFSAMEEMYGYCTSFLWNRTKYENIRDSIIYYDQLKNYEKLESDYVGQTCKPDLFQKLANVFKDGLFPNQLEMLKLVITIKIGDMETLVDGNQACKIVEKLTPFKDAFIEAHTEPCPEME